MRNEAGYEASVSNYGATLVRMVMPDREGQVRHVDSCLILAPGLSRLELKVA